MTLPLHPKGPNQVRVCGGCRSDARGRRAACLAGRPLVGAENCLRETPQIQHHFKQLLSALIRSEFGLHCIRKQGKKPIEIVSDPLRAHRQQH